MKSSFFTSPHSDLSPEQGVPSSCAVSLCPTAAALVTLQNRSQMDLSWQNRQAGQRAWPVPSLRWQLCRRTKAGDSVSLSWQHYSWICCLCASSTSACDFPHSTSAPIKIAAFSQMFSNSSDMCILKMSVGVRESNEKCNGLRTLSAVLGKENFSFPNATCRFVAGTKWARRHWKALGKDLHFISSLTHSLFPGLELSHFIFRCFKNIYQGCILRVAIVFHYTCTMPRSQMKSQGTTNNIARNQHNFVALPWNYFYELLRSCTH